MTPNEGTERTWNEIREQRRRICLVPCRQCGAPPGKPCRSPSGGYPQGPHGSRRADAAEAGLWVPGGTAERTP